MTEEEKKKGGGAGLLVLLIVILLGVVVYFLFFRGAIDFSAIFSRGGSAESNPQSPQNNPPPATTSPASPDSTTTPPSESNPSNAPLNPAKPDALTAPGQTQPPTTGQPKTSHVARNSILGIGVMACLAIGIMAMRRRRPKGFLPWLINRCEKIENGKKGDDVAKLSDDLKMLERTAPSGREATTPSPAPTPTTGETGVYHVEVSGRIIYGDIEFAEMTGKQIYDDDSIESPPSALAVGILKNAPGDASPPLQKGIIGHHGRFNLKFDLPRALEPVTDGPDISGLPKGIIVYAVDTQHAEKKYYHIVKEAVSKCGRGGEGINNPDNPPSFKLRNIAHSGVPIEFTDTHLQEENIIIPIPYPDPQRTETSPTPTNSNQQ